MQIIEKLKSLWPWGKKPSAPPLPSYRAVSRVSPAVPIADPPCPHCSPKPAKSGRLYTNADAARDALAERMKRRNQ